MAFKMKGNPLKMGSMATKSTMKMAKESATKMKKESPMEMKKKSPMKLGDPKKEMTQAEKDAAIANAMPAARKVSISEETAAGAKKYGFMEDGYFNRDKAKGELRKLQQLGSGSTPRNLAKQAEIRKIMKAYS